MLPTYRRNIVSMLINRMREPKRFIQVVTGPRQTGKTTAVRQCLDTMRTEGYETKLVRACDFYSNPRLWLEREWNESRQLSIGGKCILAIDEIQTVPQWSSIVKDLWDADADNDVELKVILTGSSSLLFQQGLLESLTGRFEVIPCYQWDFNECEEAFGFTLDQYLYFGGYPGASSLIADEYRWLDYMQASIITPSILKDVFALDRVSKPALMERLFGIGSSYSGQEISYRKLLGQLDDAGNTATVARYATLLYDAGLLADLKKYSGKMLTTRSSSPRFCVFDTSFMVASYGRDRKRLLEDSDLRGHLVESAVGAYLLRHRKAEHFDVNWWRERSSEVDFVVSDASRVTAIEVKSGRIKSVNGLDTFHAKYGNQKSIVVGSHAAPLDEFLRGHIELF